jgi:hypothetical protein
MAGGRARAIVRKKTVPAIVDQTDEHLWLKTSEALWNKAHEIARRQADLDPGDIYHALRAQALTPSERLRRGLTRVRVRPHAG